MQASGVSCVRSAVLRNGGRNVLVLPRKVPKSRERHRVYGEGGRPSPRPDPGNACDLSAARGVVWVSGELGLSRRRQQYDLHAIAGHARSASERWEHVRRQASESGSAMLIWSRPSQHGAAPKKTTLTGTPPKATTGGGERFRPVAKRAS